MSNKKYDSPNQVNRREFAKLSAAVTLASTGVNATTRSNRFAVVDDFQRVNSFYHGDGWESLNPGYWKLENNALRRRLHTRGDKARDTGFPFHATQPEKYDGQPCNSETNQCFSPDYETKPPYGMIWRRDWRLQGNYRVSIDAVIHTLPSEDEEASYSLMGICIGGRTLFESWNGAGDEGDACWYAAWRDNGIFGVYDHTTDEAKPVQHGSTTRAPKLKPGDHVTVEIDIAGSDDLRADVTATLKTTDAQVKVTCTNVDRKRFIEGFVGLVSRGQLDFEVTEFRVDPGDNIPLNEPVNELQVCYPLGDTLRQIDGEWHCRFVAIFRQEGETAEIRISLDENPKEGWQVIAQAGKGSIITNGFRRATAVIDCVLPAEPDAVEMYYTVWKDGVNVTADPRSRARDYVGRLPRLVAPYRLCGLSCHAISGPKPGLKRTAKYQENWIHEQPLLDAFLYIELFDFQVLLWEDDVWYLELVLYTTSTDDAYKIITITLGNPVTRWQMMRHWNVINPGDHDYGMDDVKGPEQIAIRTKLGLGQDPEYMQRNFQIVQHLIAGDDSPSGIENPKRWRRWKMPQGDFSLLVLDSRLWRTSQDTHIWETRGWPSKGHTYDREDPTRSLLGEEQFAWLQQTIRTDSSSLLCVTGINGMHTIWQPSVKAEQDNRVAADYAGWVKAGCDRVIELLSARDGIVSVYGDVHIGSIIRNREARLYECSFGPIGRTGGRRPKSGFGKRMTDYDDRDLDMIAFYHEYYESPELKKQTNPGYWNFLEMEFDTRPKDAKIGLWIRRLDEPPTSEPRGGGHVYVGASDTGRPIDCSLPRIKTLPSAEIYFSTMDGQPIRGSRSRADGSLPVSGLVGIVAGSEVVITAYDGERIASQVVTTLALQSENTSD